MIVYIDPVAEQIMTDHAVNTYPSASSGYLFGTHDADGKKIYGTLAIDSMRSGTLNVSASAMQRKAEQYARERKWQLLGMYHSCPDKPAMPDSHTATNDTELHESHVFISVCHANLKDIRSWVMKSCGRFEEEMILAFRQLHTI